MDVRDYGSKKCVKESTILADFKEVKIITSENKLCSTHAETNESDIDYDIYLNSCVNEDV